MDEKAEIKLLRRIEVVAEELYKALDDSEYTIGRMSTLARAHEMYSEVSYRPAMKKLRKLLGEYEEKFFK